MSEKYEYSPGIFEREDETHAREIILTHEAGLTTAERWELETHYMTPVLAGLPKGPVIDYGCGIGRLSKLLVEAGHPVFGVEQSEAMRTLARDYVGPSAGFFAIDPDHFTALVDTGAKFASAIAVWVLQHIPEPFLPVERIAEALTQDGVFLVVNRTHRCLPVKAPNGEQTWLDDRFDLDAHLAKYFVLDHEEPMPPDLCEPGAYLRMYRKP